MTKPPAEHPLKIWRQKQRPPLTQGELGEKLDLSDMAISNYEGGRVPKRGVIDRICAFTGLKITDFYPRPAGIAGNSKETKAHGRKTETSGRGKAAKKEKGSGAQARRR